MITGSATGEECYQVEAGSQRGVEAHDDLRDESVEPRPEDEAPEGGVESGSSGSGGSGGEDDGGGAGSGGDAGVSGLPDEDAESPPLGVPSEAADDPPDPGPDAMPGIPTEGEPPSSG